MPTTMTLFTISRRGLQLENISPVALNLLCALLSLLIASMLLASILLLLKRYRESPKCHSTLPMYEKQSNPRMRSYHRRTHSTYSIPDAARYSKSSTIFSYEEYSRDINTTSKAPVETALPEIRLTLPDEVDAAGHYRSGRVLLVRIGENSEGLEPLDSSTTSSREKDLEAFPRQGA